MDTNQRCGGCKYWRRFLEPEASLHPGWGCCERIQFLTSEDSPLLSTEIAVLDDNSGVYAAVRSKADFGCVLFEPEG